MAVGTNGPPVLAGSAYVYPEKTLAQLRKKLLIKLGYAAQLASPPTGMAELLNAFLEDANDQLYKRYSTLRQKRWWQIPIVQGSRFYDVPYEGAYYEGIDIAIVNGSPDTITTVNGDFTAAGFTIGMRINISGSDADDGYHEIANVAAQTLTLTTSTTVTGETAGNQIRVAEDSFVSLDLREIVYAGLLDGEIWNDMIPGIDPLMFNNTSQQRPTHYQIREYVEVFPEPNKAYTLYLAGRSALKPLTADSHVTSVDPDIVYIQALAEAKAHYGQRDAQVYFQRLEQILGDLNSDSYSTDRFIPNPQPHLPARPYPQTTFTRG